MLLKVSNLHVRYGAIAALRGVSLDVEEGQIVTLIGSNGAGKTTLLRTISGLLRPAEGQITWQDKTELHRLRPDQIVGLGISHVPEGRQVFANLTVRENLILGAYQQPTAILAGDIENVYEAISGFGRAAQSALRHTQRRRAADAGHRAGADGSSRLLLLDEPSLGLAPMIVRKIFDIIRQINAAGTTVLLVEQNAHMALAVAHRGYVLQSGQIILADTAASLLADPEVKRAYLGG